MNHKTALVTGGMAATILAATAVAMPALAASEAKSVTEQFDAKSSSSPLMFSKTTLVSTDNDVMGGKSIGRDVLSCTASGTSVSKCHVAFAQKGGFLYVEFTLSNSTGALKGTVTGTGSFAGAKGTLAGRTESRTDVKITLHYTK